MHKYVHDTLMNHVKKTYSCPDKFTVEDLCELKLWGKAMKELLEADKIYNIINAMEDEHDYSDVDMEWDEFIMRFTKMYNDRDVNEKETIKAEIMKIIG